MKICVLVKEVPDAAVRKRLDPATGRLDRGGERNLNPYDTHAIEAAMQLREGGAVEVDEIVAVTMGPESAVRALHKAVSLGADRSLHLCDDGARRLGCRGDRLRAGGGARARVAGSRAARPAVRRRRVLHGRRGRRRPPADAVADAGDQARRQSTAVLRCERQAEYGYDTVEVGFPAVIAVGDAINEPRYPALKAIMGAKKKPLETLDDRRRRDRSGARRRRRTRRRSWVGAKEPPRKPPGRLIEDRGHRRDGRADRRLAGRRGS